MKLRTVPKHIEDYVNAIQLKLAQESAQMSTKINLTQKEFQFLAETFKKIYSSGMANEAAGILWAEQLLVEEIKSRCPNFNESLWNVEVGFEWLRNRTPNIPEQDAHEDQ